MGIRLSVIGGANFCYEFYCRLGRRFLEVLYACVQALVNVAFSVVFQVKLEQPKRLK